MKPVPPKKKRRRRKPKDDSKLSMRARAILERTARSRAEIDAMLEAPDREELAA